MKLIKVMEGLYRTDYGVHVMHNMDSDKKEFKWRMTWTDIFSVRKCKKFKTLKEVREELNRS